MFTKEKNKDLHYSISGKIAAEDLQKAADEVLLEFGKTAKMPGFRAGHIPLSVLRQKYNGQALNAKPQPKLFPFQKSQKPHSEHGLGDGK